MLTYQTQVIHFVRELEQLEAQDQSESVVHFSHSSWWHRSGEIRAVSLRVHEARRIQGTNLKTEKDSV